MGFWTRVRLPSTPLKSKRSNTVQICNIAVFKNEFGIVLDTSGYGAEQIGPNDYPLTYSKSVNSQKNFTIKNEVDMVHAAVDSMSTLFFIGFLCFQSHI